MTVSPETSTPLGAPRARQRAVWELGDYPALAAAVIPDLGAVLVDACGIDAGDRVLDVAAGAGNAAIPAALKGASVVACDVAPELLRRGRELADERGAELEWREGDAEALPFADAAFDAVVSCVGVMFAPGHQASADELVRVCRPGGVLGLASWTPEGFVGEMLATVAPFAPPSPPGALAPPLWGDEAHVRALLGDRVADVRAERRVVTVSCFPDPEAFRDGFRSLYGPTIAVYRAIGADPEKVAALDAALVALARRHDRGEGSTVMDWEYLLVTARRRGRAA